MFSFPLESGGTLFDTEKLINVCLNGSFHFLPITLPKEDKQMRASCGAWTSIHPLRHNYIIQAQFLFFLFLYSFYSTSYKLLKRHFGNLLVCLLMRYCCLARRLCSSLRSWLSHLGLGRLRYAFSNSTLHHVTRNVNGDRLILFLWRLFLFR